MRVLTLRTAAIALVAGLGLGGCAYGPYGGLGVGYGSNGYYDPYYGGGYYGAGYSPYGGYGYGYGAPYYGWNDGFYYPGTGYYVYDRYRNPYRWSDAQRRYWESRRARYNRGDSGTNRIIQNWADFQNGPQANVREQRVATTRTIRSRDITTQQQINAERARARFEAQQARSERQTARNETRSERQSARSEARSERRGLRIRNARGKDND